MATFFIGSIFDRIARPCTPFVQKLRRIDRSRGSPALRKFFTEVFEGTLVTDFWDAYNAVVCAWRPTCLVHLFRQLEQTEKYVSPGQNRPEFMKKLRRLPRDGIRLWHRRDEYDEATYASRRQRLANRLEQN